MQVNVTKGVGGGLTKVDVEPVLSQNGGSKFGEHFFRLYLFRLMKYPYYWNKSIFSDSDIIFHNICINVEH